MTYDEKGNEVIATFSGDDYWEWRTTVEEMEHAKTKHDLMLMKLRLMEKDAKILTMEIAFFKQRIKETGENKEFINEQYDVYKERLENKYGISLSECLIKDTYEVVKAPQNEDQGGE